MRRKEPKTQARRMRRSAQVSLSNLSLANLLHAYEAGRNQWDRRLRAEVTFALALAFKASADSMGEGFRDAKREYTDSAKEFAAECLRLLAELPSSTLRDVATPHTSLAGVIFPDYLYDKVAEKRFRDAGLLK